jgi:hypothetical protein
VDKEKQYAARGIQGGPMHYPTHSTSAPVSIMKAHMVKVAAWGTVSSEPRDHELTGDRFHLTPLKSQQRRWVLNAKLAEQEAA